MHRHLTHVLLAMALTLAATGRAEGHKPRAPARAAHDLHGDPLPPGAVLRLGTVRFRSADVVECVAVSPDGKTVAAGCRAADQVGSTDVILWDTATGRRVGQLTGHKRAVNDLAFSPDGRLLASAA